MVAFVPAIIATAVCGIALTAIFAFVPAFSEKREDIISKGIIYTVISIVIAAAFSLIISASTLLEKAPSITSAVITAACCYCSFMLNKFITWGALKKFLKRLGIITICAFLFEGIICNFRSFTTDKKDYVPIFTQSTTDNPDTVHISEEKITFDSDGSIVIPVYSENIGCVTLEMDGYDTFLKSTVYITDDNFSKNPIPVGSKYTSGKYGKPVSYGISGYGEIKEIKIQITENLQPLDITSIKFNSAMPYEFSDLRFILLLVFAVLINAIISFKIYKMVYERTPVQKIILLGITAICASSVFMFNIPEERPVNYSADQDMTYADPYIQMADAVMEGRLTIDITPSQELLILENPYDNSLRDDVPYVWDRAFYNGEYYSYYGIAPVLTFYFPYYFINGDLPTMNTACQFFGMLSIVFMFGAITSFVKRFIKKPNFLMLIIMMVSSSVISGVFMSVDYSNQYNVPVVSSTAFLMLCLWCGVSACNNLSQKAAVPLFALSGLSFVLCVASRPSKALSALILAPLFIWVLVNKNEKLKKRIISASAFLVPVVIGMAAIMWYNNARFESPFDFGQGYQLTVNNVNANKINLSLFPSAILRYFLQPVDFIGDFPYVRFNAVTICNNGQYVYDAASCGVLNFPVILLGIVIMPMLVWHTRHRNTTPWKYNENRIRNYTYVLMLLIAVGVAFADYCMGGIIIDYLNDILPVLMLMSILVLLETQQRLEKFPVLAGKGVCVFSFAAIVSVILFLAIMLEIRDYSLFKNFPNIYFESEKLFCFWH